MSISFILVIYDRPILTVSKFPLGSRSRLNHDTSILSSKGPISKPSNSSNVENLFPRSYSPKKSPGFRFLDINSNNRSHIPISKRTPTIDTPPRHASPTRLRFGINSDKSPSRSLQKPNPILETPRRNLRVNRQVEPLSITRSIPSHYSRARAQTDDILRTLNTDTISSSVNENPTDSPTVSTALKRTFSSSAAQKSPSLISTSTYSVYDTSLTDFTSTDSTDDLFGTKKRRKVTFNDRISTLQGADRRQDAFDQPQFAKLDPSLDRRNIFHMRSKSADIFSHQHSRQQFLEDVLKHQDAKFTRDIESLQRRVEKQALEIDQLKQENKKFKSLLKHSFHFNSPDL